jgi:hypothetical protein
MRKPACLMIIGLAFGLTMAAVAQGPGSCAVAAEGTCVRPNGTACKTAPNVPKNDGTCQSTKLGHGDIVGSCVCQANPAPAPKKDDGPGETALFVFLALLSGWLGMKIRAHRQAKHA